VPDLLTKYILVIDDDPAHVGKTRKCKHVGNALEEAGMDIIGDTE
jgi:hypothetical protein